MFFPLHQDPTCAISCSLTPPKTKTRQKMKIKKQCSEWRY